MKCPQYFLPADILLPDFSVCDGRKWATVACDQFTSEPEYWEKVAAYVGDAPVYLENDDSRSVFVGNAGTVAGRSREYGTLS